MLYNLCMIQDIRVSISEAARLFGVSVKTIRQAIKEGQLIYIVVNGRYKINFKSLVIWSQLSTRRRNLLSSEGIGRYVDNWRIQNPKFSPRAPKNETPEEPQLTDPDIIYEETKADEDEPRI